ncbi:MAG TPA: ligase-associated DNA damage response exonuclease [Nannocystis sp.]
MPAPLVELTEDGLLCRAGGFYVDPWRPVERAIITHAHGDHAQADSEHYLAATPGLGVLRLRVGASANIHGLAYGEAIKLGEVTVSLHPAGHILGSAQVRIERAGEVWVVSGDYKLGLDPTCTPFEPVRCHTFISESTFGLPVYRWAPQSEIFEDINNWWAGNKAAGKASLLLCYALGKAQRILAGIDGSIGPVYLHGAVERVTQAYRAAGVLMVPTKLVGPAKRGDDWKGSLILAPPSALHTPWGRRFRPLVSGFASGWMRVRGARRRRAVDRGFVLSDHADWPGLLAAISATGASRVLVTHGHAAPLTRFLQEQGLEAEVLATQFVGEGEEASDAGAENKEPARETEASEEVAS